MFLKSDESFEAYVQRGRLFFLQNVTSFIIKLKIHNIDTLPNRVCKVVTLRLLRREKLMQRVPNTSHVKWTKYDCLLRCPWGIKKDNQRGCTNARGQVARATKFCTLAPDICGSLVWNLLHVTNLAPRIFRWLLDFWNMCPLPY